MSVETIHRKMLDNIGDHHDKSDAGFVYDVTKSVAVAVSSQEKVSSDTIDKVDIENLTGDELSRFVFQRSGITRKVATYATTTVLLTGTPLTAVPVGSLVAADDVFYETTKAVFLDDKGQTTILGKCQVDGPVGNVPVGAINSFPVTLTGITSVTNLSAVNNGYVGETDTDLRQRYYDRLQRPGRAGNAYHYEEWAMAVIGVGKVKVAPLWNGPLTVKVVLVDANGEIPSTDLLNTVMEYISIEAPFGATVTIVGAQATTINVSVDITVAEGLTNEDVQNALEEQIISYLKGLAFESNYVSRAQIGKIILETTGIVDYVDLMINEDNANVEIPEAHIPFLGKVTLL